MLVQIHSKVEADSPGPGGDRLRQLAVTFSTDIYAPRTIFLPLDKSDDAAIAAAIRQEVLRLDLERPQLLEI